MAKSPPADLAALKAIQGVSADQAERRGKELLAAVHRGVELPDSELPRIVRPPRRAPDLAFEARLERLKGARNLLAVKYELPPGVICPNGTLEAIARVNPTTMDALARVEELRRWQLKEFGQDLLTAVPAPA